MRAQTEPIAARSLAGRRTVAGWVGMFALSLVAAATVGALDWAGMDRTTGARFMAGLWTFVAAHSVLLAAYGRKLGLPRSSIVGDVCGGSGAACMAVAQLASGLVAGAFMLATLGFMVASIAAFHRYRREVKAIVPAKRDAVVHGT